MRRAASDPDRVGQRPASLAGTRRRTGARPYLRLSRVDAGAGRMNAVPFVAIQAALLDMRAPLPAGLTIDATTRERFAVHRHTCRGALIDALQAAYPSVVSAVGSAYFNALAAAFI